MVHPRGARLGGGGAAILERRIEQLTASGSKQEQKAFGSGEMARAYAVGAICKTGIAVTGAGQYGGHNSQGAVGDDICRQSPRGVPQRSAGGGRNVMVEALH
jgi:hypothetical protein